MSPEINHQIHHNTANAGRWKLASKIIISVLALFQLYMLTKYVPIAEFGILAIARVAFGLAILLADSGMKNALIVHRNLSNHLFSTLYWINLIFVIILAFLLTILAPWLGVLYEMSSLSTILNVFALTLVIHGAGIFYKSLLHKEFKIKTIALINIISVFAGVVTALIASYYRPEAISLAFGLAMQMILAALAFIVYGYSIHPLRRKLQYEGLAYFFNFGRFQIGERLLHFMHNKVDVLIIGKLLGDEILGVYDIFKQILNRPESLINPVLDFIALPIMTKKSNNIEYIRDIYMRMLSFSATILFPVYAALIVIAPHFVFLFFGESWGQHVVLFQWLCVYFIFHSTLNHVGTLWIARSRPDIGFYWNLVMFLILPVGVFLAARYHIEWVVIAGIGMWIIVFYPLYRLVIHPLIGLTWKRYYKVFLPPLLWGVSPFAILYGVTVGMYNIYYVSLLTLITSGIVLWLYRKYHNEVWKSFTSILWGNRGRS